MYNTRAQAVVDSLFLAGHAYEDIEVTADERFLIASDTADSTWVFDLATRQQVRQLGFGGEIEVSASGRYVAVEGEFFRVLDASTFGELMADSVRIRGGSFERESDIFYGPLRDSIVRRYDVPGDSLLPDLSFPLLSSGPNIARVLPLPGGSRVFLHDLSWADDPWPWVYGCDEVTDSISFKRSVGSMYTDLELTPDGKTVLFTDPLSDEAYATGNVFYVDVATNVIVAIVPPIGPRYAGWLLGAINSAEMAITPDGKYCLMGSGPTATPYFGILSVPDRVYVKYDSLGVPGSGNYGVVKSVACRKWLKP